MRKSSNRATNERKWRERVARAAQRSGPVAEFCRREGVSPASFRYWQRKLNPTESALSPFVPVEILERAAQQLPLPDARWVAELIFHLHSRGVER